jgi:hypothetical protein
MSQGSVKGHPELGVSCFYSPKFLEGLFPETELPEMPIVGNP